MPQHWRLGVQGQGPSTVGQGSSFGLHTSHCILTRGGRSKGALWSSLETLLLGTNPIRRATPSGTKHFRKASPTNTIIFGLQHMNFGETQIFRPWHPPTQTLFQTRLSSIFPLKPLLMAPAHCNILKKQLWFLVTKGFLCWNVSSWNSIRRLGL